MAAAEVDVRPAESAPAVPDYLASPNAVFEDKDAQWRYGHPPDYSKTRAEWERTKTMKHEAGSLPQLVENLVKNWEVEASFKPRLEDWRTIDHANYTFAINGGPPQTAEHMLKVGTYNAIVAPNEYYSPEHSDFATSHKTFKRMMPTFAWEVLEVYSGPPRVAFRWRHWGDMKSDYVGFNNKGEKVTAKAHGGKIDIEGVTVAEVDDKVRLRKVETWFDPMEMFRQIAPQGIVNKEIVDTKVFDSQPPADLPVNDGIKIAEDHNSSTASHTADVAPETAIAKDISPSTSRPADEFVPHQGTASLEQGNDVPRVVRVDNETIKDIGKQATDEDNQAVSSSQLKAQPEQMTSDNQIESTTSSDNGATSDSSDKTWEKIERPEGRLEDLKEHVIRGETLTTEGSGLRSSIDDMNAHDDVRDGHAENTTASATEMETAVKPDAGEAVAVPAGSQETRITYEEMSNITPMECPFLMNRE